MAVEDVAATLDVDRRTAAKLLSRWVEQGWLVRIRRGLYAPLPLDAIPETTTIENPWRLVPAVFAPGYVGGWSAAEHWDLTEQIFRHVCVFTARPFRRKHQTMEGTTFVLHRMPEPKIFGTTLVWDSGDRIPVSDPHRTIVDLLARPETGGGMVHVVECLRRYLRSEHRDVDKLIDYGDRLGSGVVFKRLGFLLEAEGIDREALDRCAARLSAGYSAIDPALPKDRIVTKWRLWLPKGWKDAS